FGLVGLDRFAINILFPAMRGELGLTYQDLGNVSAVLALAWGISAVCLGPLADRFGTRAVVVPSVIIFSLMAGQSGIATGLASLLVFRLLMGVAEGAFAPASITATMDAAAQRRKTLVSGIQQCGLSLV